MVARPDSNACVALVNTSHLSHVMARPSSNKLYGKTFLRSVSFNSKFHRFLLILRSFPMLSPSINETVGVYG